MAGTSDFLWFAGGALANVEALATYDGYAGDGFPSGILPAAKLNRALRQGTAASAYVGEVSRQILQENIKDDGTLFEIAVQYWRHLLKSSYFVDTGSANSIVIGPFASYVFPVPTAGLRTTVKMAFDNTSPTVNLNWHGTGNIRVEQRDGVTDPFPGDLKGGQEYDLLFDGTIWRILNLVQSYIKPALPPAGLTLYVRTDGNDNNNDGSLNTAGSAFATIAGAINFAATKYSLTPARLLTIILGLAGTYAASIIPSGCSILIQGLNSTIANYVISGGASIDVITTSYNSIVNLTNLTVNNTGTLWNWLSCAFGSSMSLNNVGFTRSGGASSVSVISCFPGGSMSIGNLTFTGIACGVGVGAHGAGGVSISGTNTAVFTFAGTNSFGNGFAATSDNGSVECGILGISVSGTVTGLRYNASLNGVINTNGQGVSLFPGTIAGTTSSGGQYN